MNVCKSILLILAAVCINSCGNNGSEATGTQQDKPVELARAETDTSGAQGQGNHEDEMARSEAGKTEIETRLEGLISLIEERENSLLTREQNLLEREQALNAELQSLRDRERSAQSMQIVSWIVLAIGLASIAGAVIVSRRPRKITTKEPAPVKKEAKSTASKTNESKDAYIKKMESQLKDWEAKIDELKTRASKAKDEAKAEYKKQIDTLSKKLTSAREKLQEMKDAGGDAWQELKGGVEKAWGDMKKAVENAAEKLK